MSRPTCTCFDQYDAPTVTEVRFHADQQDTSCDAWHHLLELIEQAAHDQRTEFAPFRDLNPAEREQIVTLQPSIARLTAVKHLHLYGSFLVRMPAEIGAMQSLEVFTPYTSHRLHWFPYEITRCTKLKQSTVSTRSLYGNDKLRPPFPKLQPGRESTHGLDRDKLQPREWGATSIHTCSVCNRSLDNTELYQVWISLWVATDVLPLLVNACSQTCIQSLPQPPQAYVQKPHTGGLGIQ